MRKTTLHKKLSSLRKNQMILIKMILKPQRIYLDLCSSRRNVGILKQSNDCGEVTRNINQKKEVGRFTSSLCPLCDKCCRREYFFNKHVEYCESVRQAWFFLWLHFSCRQALYNLRRRKMFSNQINVNHPYIILGRGHRKRCTMKKLRCPNSAVNETF